MRNVVIFSQGIANIGDAFVTFGLKYIIKETLKPDKIYVVGSPYGSAVQYPEKKYYNILRMFVPSGVRQKVIYKMMRNSISTAFEYVQFLEDINYIVLGGCFLTSYYTQKDLKFLLEIKDKSRILFIGVGGENYTKYEVEEVRKFLSKLRPYLLVTRDSLAYQLYNHYAMYSYNGIDNAFFVSDIFSPPKLKTRYIILNFDHSKEPEVQNPENLPLIRMHNNIKAVPKKWLKQKNFFVSDYPENYLTLIANADYIYTDRIHTSVVAEAYRKQYKYYGKNVRTEILKRIIGKKLQVEKKLELKFIKSVTDG